ncbi:hypothetical protein BFJ63_vAg16951 [Fusarium oxysporum f. sp. narcissi]|uniref:Major facilitator superfamily (MFS) profile domain-containing protein n=2 Tax=Fusarium oxysporum TaxID=5507 RepID=A0A4Q2V879_FUSOX|nr:MFS transporter, DHA1 family, multidrug resistance protein [Fusarium oxysporum f. sp. pisi HDV247]RYC80157.1 hypothetical protein BFJ63_vAg16951 [Fusarium oxysporum f. sp. narcissi]
MTNPALDDPDNPQNWGGFKKGFIAFQICFYSFAVYFGSSIYVGAVPEIVERYGISIEVSSLALALYVFGYGIGPMIFSPLSEYVLCSKFLALLPSATP